MLEMLKIGTGCVSTFPKRTKKAKLSKKEDILPCLIVRGGELAGLHDDREYRSLL
jgi:hypothetical protein